MSNVGVDVVDDESKTPLVGFQDVEQGGLEKVAVPGVFSGLRGVCYDRFVKIKRKAWLRCSVLDVRGVPEVGVEVTTGVQLASSDRNQCMHDLFQVGSKLYFLLRCKPESGRNIVVFKIVQCFHCELQSY